MTPNMEILLYSEPRSKEIPDFVKGDVGEIGDIIVSGKLCKGIILCLRCSFAKL